MEIGTAMDGISVARARRRNRNTTSVTSATASSSVSSVSCNAARIVVVRSLAMVTWTSLGSAASSSGSAAVTWSTVSMMLAPGWRNSSTTTEGVPSDRPMLRRFSTESITSATSASLTGAPLRQARISGL